MSIRSIKAFLNQPYLEDQGLFHFFKSCLAISVFIGLFLYIFEPFGMSRTGDQKAYFSFMFGLITFVISFGFDLFLRYVLGLHRDTENWVFWKWMVTVLIILVLIAMGNYFFMWRFSGSAMSLQGFAGALVSTFLIGIFPVFFIGFINTRRASKAYRQVAETISISSKELVVPSRVQLIHADSRDPFDIDTTNILFIEAMQNYVNIYYEVEGQIQQKILRSTLNAIEEQLIGTSITRAHRSYLVNRNKIVQVAGNAQGLRLTLSGLHEGVVPVSRRYIRVFQ